MYLLPFIKKYQTVLLEISDYHKWFKDQHAKGITTQTYPGNLNQQGDVFKSSYSHLYRKINLALSISRLTQRQDQEYWTRKKIPNF